MDNKLEQQLWAIAKEIARQFGEVIGSQPDYWVSDDPTGICSFGDTYFFNLTEMKQVIDNLPRYIQRYGNREAVGEEIANWTNWWLDNQPADTAREFITERIIHTVRPKISLKAWLDGAPRATDAFEPSRYRELQNVRSVLIKLVAEFGPHNTLADVLEDVRTDYLIAKAEHDKKLEDEMKRIMNRHTHEDIETEDRPH